MKNKVFPTRVTPGASYEQVKIEQEMNKMIIKSNRWSFVFFLLIFSIIGIPIAVILFLVKGKELRKDNKRINELAKELDELVLREAFERKN